MADYLDRENEEDHRFLFGISQFGYCVAADVNDDGESVEVFVGVDPTPITPECDSKELRTFMRAIALSWLDQLETIPFVEPAPQEDEPLTFIIIQDN